MKTIKVVTDTVAMFLFSILSMRERMQEAKLID